MVIVKHEKRVSYIRHLICLIMIGVASTLLTGCMSVVPNKGKAALPEEKLVFVYAHGFGGEKANPRFCVNLKKLLKKAPYKCEVQNYKWDSVHINVTKAGANWIEAARRADAESVKFKSTVIDKLESERTPYVLVAFSLGSRVMFKAIEQSKGNLKMLRGVYFLGSAMPADMSMDKSCLPPGMKITNYHSPSRDKVHQIAFNFMQEVPAGGREGFDSKELFENYAVSCSHACKGVGPHMDYSQLAYSVGYVALMRERIFIPGKTAYNIETGVGAGDAWWNKILAVDCSIKGQPVTLEIEQYSMNLDYFRAVAISADGSRRRVARGKNIHAILSDLKVLPASYWR